MPPVPPETVVTASIVKAVEAAWSAGGGSLTPPDNSHDEGCDERAGPARWPCPEPRFAVVRCTCCARTWERQVECGDRSCRPCRLHRALLFGARWHDALSRWKIGYFLTLTWPNQAHEPTLEDIKNARERWRKFRRKAKSWLIGGWYTIECTHGEHGFNLHLHALVLSRIDRPQALVHQEWIAACPDSRWTHVSAVRSHRAALGYLVKEIAKGSDVALPAGARLVQRFGTVGAQPVEIVARCPYCGSAGTVEVEIDVWEWGRIARCGD